MKITVNHGGEQLGPYTFDEVRTLLEGGKLRSTDLAWVEGTPSWVSLSSLVAGGGAPPPSVTGSVWPTAVAPSSGLAVTSLILGISSLLCGTVFTGIPAIICGHMARSRIQRAPGELQGAGLALSGLIMGYLSVALLVLMVPMVTAVVLPVLQRQADSAKNAVAQTQIRTFQVALESYRVDTESYPSTGEGLAALVQQPAHQPGWRGPYVASVPADPWGHPYVYHFPGQENHQSFDLLSAGPDGRLGTSDDVTMGDEGILNEEEDGRLEKGK